MYLFFFTNLLFALFIYMVLYSRLPNKEGRTSAVTFWYVGQPLKKDLDSETTEYHALCSTFKLQTLEPRRIKTDLVNFNEIITGKLTVHIYYCKLQPLYFSSLFLSLSLYSISVLIIFRIIEYIPCFFFTKTLFTVSS